MLGALLLVVLHENEFIAWLFFTAYICTILITHQLARVEMSLGFVISKHLHRTTYPKTLFSALLIISGCFNHLSCF